MGEISRSVHSRVGSPTISCFGHVQNGRIRRQMDMRAFARLICACLFAIAAFSQPAEPAPEFEVAAIHASAKTNNAFPFMRGPSLRAGRYEMRYATMVDLVRTAYNVDAEKVQGGPSWLEMDRFDLTGKPPSKVSPEVFRSMLQKLLADRFKLVVHPDTKSMPSYALTAGKHPTLKKSDGSGNTGCKFTPPSPPPPGGPPSLPVLQYTCRNMTMAAFADAMRT